MKVLIVDDSIVFRSAIKAALAEDSTIEQLDVAANGKIAIDKLKQNNYDAITLDLEMPIMDGTEAIKEIRKFNKNVAIIIFSAQNLNAANKTLKALELGADDFVQKLQESGDVSENLQNIKDQLIPKFNALVNRRKLRNNPIQSISASTKPNVQQVQSNVDKVDVHNFKSDLLVIGSSTGGPDLLMKIFKELPRLDVPVLLVQHMPPLFTTQLASALNRESGLIVKEAEQGDVVEAGHCYIAPGDYHMRVIKQENGKLVITLDQEPKVCYVRPAVDCLFESVSNVYDGKVGAFVLTGMGSDGADGCEYLKKKNTAVVIQDEESAVVWGMPGAVHSKGCHDYMTNPSEIIQLINSMGTL